VFILPRRVSAAFAVAISLAACTAQGAFAQQQPPVFTPGNLVVAVSGCATKGGTCTNNTYPGAPGSINGTGNTSG
jgi:hypothetical protein